MQWMLVLNIIETVNFWIGLVVGCFLLYCIVFKTSSDVGYFKYLQLIFVANDILCSVAAFVLKEKIITHEFKFCLTLLGADNQLCVCLYVTSYGSIILIVAVNFLYRLWAVRWPDKTRLFGQLRFVSILCLVIFIVLLTWLCTCLFLFVATPEAREELRNQMMTKYEVDSMTRAMIIGDYRRDGNLNIRPVCGLVVLALIIASAIGLVIYSSISIVIYLRQTKVMSPKTRQLQYALFRMLAIQAVIPIVLVHGCSGSQLTLPLFGVNIEVYSDFCTALLSFLTPLDSLSVIFLLKDYRRATVSMLKCSNVSSFASNKISRRNRMRQVEYQPNIANK